MNDGKRNENRDGSGRYAHDLARVCVCGQTKGNHLAVAPFAGLDDRCPGFKLDRKRNPNR